MIAKFFVDRPVFAWVISIVIVLCGLVSLYTLPIESSPQITPPTVIIGANYPGADAETVMVNYRVQGDRYIVDTVFDKAILIAGVGSSQDRVTITRRK